jgi:hypothetical protein
MTTRWGTLPLLGITLVLAVTPTVLVGPAKAAMAVAGSPKVVLVVDISSSMDDQDRNGTVKIEGAKRALLNLVQGLPPTTIVGLHPYPGDGGCSPGSTIDGLDASSDGLRSAIAGLSARGNTPTGPALRDSADHILAQGGDPVTIVLVSDGESNCGPDPCEVAKQVAAEGVNITVNTVGFEISGGGADELRCIADATKGRYFDAGDSEALLTSLNDAATPRLSVEVLEPQPNATVGAGSIVTVAAMVRNVSNQRLDDVRTLLTFPPAPAGKPANLDPGIAGAIKYLGNLAVSESRRVEWSYRVAVSQDGSRSTMVVYATAANAAPQKATLQVSYGNALELSSAGPLLRNATHAAILGDSYSSGEGSGDYYLNTNLPDLNSCHRSDNTYAMSLWERKPLLLACSGATTDNIYGPNEQNHEASQVSQLAAAQQHDHVDLVLLTIGGNDIQFAEIIKTCVLWSQCHLIRIPTDPENVVDCFNAQFDLTTLTVNQVLGHNGLDACEPSISYRDLVIGSIGRIKDQLRHTYVSVDATVNSPDALEDRGGKLAPIIVLAYPNLMPYRAGSASQGFCSRFLSEEEARFGSEVADLLNATINSVVEEERAQGLPIYFAQDVADALRPTHTICDAQPHAVREVLWRSVTGLLESVTSGGLKFLFRQASGGVQQEQMHPNKDGYRDMTAELVRWSNTASALRPVERHRPDPWDPIPLGPVVGPVELGPGPGSATLLQPASTVTLQGDGFAPYSSVQIILHSAPTLLTVAYADADGNFEVTTRIPADIAPGKHLIVATGLDANGRPYQRYRHAEIRRPVSVATIALWAVSGMLVLLTAPTIINRLRRRKSAQRGGELQGENHA